MPQRIQYEIVPLAKDSALMVREFNYPVLDVDLHAHPEIEITYIRKGRGKHLIGSRFSNFEDSDLVLIGSGIPHLYRGEATASSLPGGADCLVIHFRKELFNADLLGYQELNLLQKLLEQGKYGIHFPAPHPKLRKRFERIRVLKGIEQFAELIRILCMLASDSSWKLLNQEYAETSAREADRDKKVYKYILDHYTGEIGIDEVARLANLSKPAFCNYFRKKTKLTFSQFINDLRCSLAARLLIETDHHVSEVAGNAGYTNQSYFNRMFLERYRHSPLQYRNLNKIS